MRGDGQGNPTARLRVAARRRGLIVIAALGLAAILPFAARTAAAASAGDASSAGAVASLAAVGTQVTGYVQVPATTKENLGVSSSALSSAALTFTRADASVSSCIRGTALISRGESTATGVSLLGGLVKADSVTVVAQAQVGAGGPAATDQGSAISGLTVGGAPVDPTAGLVDLPGVGTLSPLLTSTEAGGDSSSSQIIGLRLELSAPFGDLPAGTVITVASATARADQATFAALAPTPPPRPTPTPSFRRPPTHTPTPQPTPTPTSSPTTKPTPKPTPKATPTPAPTHGAGTGGGSNPTYPPMPAPQTNAAGLIAFPGAVFPVRGAYHYTNDWHAPRVGHLHQGCDIFAARGTPLVAVQTGFISHMSTIGLGGIAVSVMNARGDYFYYAHLSAYAAGLHVGQHVFAGEAIGYVGNTGNAAGGPTHCHFEIHPLGGAAVNPFPYLELWRAAQGGGVSLPATPSVTVLKPITPAAPVPGPLPNADNTSRTPEQQSILVPLHSNQGGGSDLPGDPITSLPLVALSAIGTAIVRRLQWGGGLL